MNPPSLEALELAVARRDWSAAFDEILRLLKSIDDRYGRVDAIAGQALGGERRAERIATRFAAAFGQIIAEPSATIAPIVYEQLAAQRRWIELIFSQSGFGSSDYLVPMLSVGELGARQVPPQSLARFLLIFSSAAGMGMNLEECFAADPPAAIAALLGELASRFCFTDTAHALRETLLEWLPPRLERVKLGALALQTLASPYMHCSYAQGPRKHDIKAVLMAQMRRGCLEAGCPELDPDAAPARSDKPTIVVTAENFSEGHSIHRTHSRAVEALKGPFHVVGLLYPQHVTPAVAALFDEVVTYRSDLAFLPTVRAAAEAILQRRPAMVLHLGVGMAPHVIGLASLRLAPVQAVSFGHTATTLSDVIDYMILPDDFVGDPACFSERLATVPARAMPYRPRTDVDYAALKAAAEAARGERPDGPVRIALPASVMKLGPPLFDALAAAAAAAARPVEYQVFPLGAAGLGHLELKQRLAARLPMAVVNEELPYDAYVQRLAACDFFVCPFPYGNMNSIVDAVLVGLPGVCLDGPEAHAHADAAYFRRMGFPEALTTRTVDDYVAAVARLASDARWLARCRKAAREADLGAAFFEGDAAMFARLARRLIDESPRPAARATPREEAAASP